jgi:hypothetical protein
MSINVELAEVRAVAAGQMPFAYLLTVSEDDAARAVAITPHIDGDTITCEAGRHSCANAIQRPNVSLLWPPADPGDYSLIVDGTATVSGSTLRITATRAVRHRPAPGGGSDCETVALERDAP